MIELIKCLDCIVAHIKRSQLLETGKTLQRRNLVVTNPQLLKRQGNILELFDFLNVVPSNTESLKFGHTG